MTDLIKNYNVIDLSHAINGNISVFPGSPVPVIDQVATVPAHGYTDIMLTMSTHTATHVDAPCHMIENGITLDQYATGSFIGTAGIIDCSSMNTREITIDHVTRFAEEPGKLDFILFYTGWSRYWGTPAYLEDFPTLSVPLASWLSEYPLKGIGFDTLSADRSDSTDYPVHKLILGRNILIIENLVNLHLLVGKKVNFICLPLKITASDASPVRALALIEH
jgi:arylformamidase